MLNKNLTYTAVTRAKKKLILCGNPNVFYKSIEPTNTISRQTALEWFFRYNSSDNEFNNKFNEDTILTFKNINIIDPMIGMNDIKPEDFL